MICTWSTKVFTIAQVVRAFHLHCLCFLIYKPSNNWLFVKLQTAHVELVSVHCFVLTLNCFIIQRFFKSCRGELGFLGSHKHGANDPALCEHNKSLFFSQMNSAPTHKLYHTRTSYLQVWSRELVNEAHKSSLFYVGSYGKHPSSISHCLREVTLSTFYEPCKKHF